MPHRKSISNRKSLKRRIFRFYPGCPIVWHFFREVRRVSYATSKRGNFHSLVNHRREYAGNQMARVYFPTNKRVVRVPFSQLEPDQ